MAIEKNIVGIMRKLVLTSALRYRVSFYTCEVFMDDQLDRYYKHRQAVTMADGTRPYAWWKKYQRSMSIPGELSEADLHKDAARFAKRLGSTEE